jgi:hypothetical protein
VFGNLGWVVQVQHIFRRPRRNLDATIFLFGKESS